MQTFLKWVSPLENISERNIRIISILWVFACIAIWFTGPMRTLPSPIEVASAAAELWSNGLGQQIIISFTLNLEALAWSTVISIIISVAGVIPFFRPMTSASTKGRFLSMAGLSYIATQLASNGHQLKLFLLVFSETVFLVTSLSDVIASAPKEKFDLARTMRMGKWEIIYEVILLGRADLAFDSLRQNAAIGWIMLTMVEGMARTEGGIGALLLNQNKHFRLEAVFAIQISILILGIFQDYILGVVKRTVCPYSELILERR